MHFFFLLLAIHLSQETDVRNHADSLGHMNSPHMHI